MWFRFPNVTDVILCCFVEREKTWAKYKIYMYWKDWQKCMKIDKMHLKYKKKEITFTFSSLPVCLCHNLNMLLLIPSLFRYLLLFSSFILSPWIKIILMHADKCRRTQNGCFSCRYTQQIIYGPVNGNFRICSFWSILWTKPLKIIKKKCRLFLETDPKVSRFHWRNLVLKFSF